MPTRNVPRPCLQAAEYSFHLLQLPPESDRVKGKRIKRYILIASLALALHAAYDDFRLVLSASMQDLQMCGILADQVHGRRGRGCLWQTNRARARARGGGGGGPPTAPLLHLSFQMFERPAMLNIYEHIS